MRFTVLVAALVEVALVAFLIAAPAYKQIGAFTVADLDGNRSPKIVAAVGDIDPRSKNKWAAEYRFVVLGLPKQIAAVDRP